MSFVAPQTISTIHKTLLQDPPEMWDSMIVGYLGRAKKYRQDPVVGSYLLWLHLQTLPPQITSYYLEDYPGREDQSRLEYLAKSAELASELVLPDVDKTRVEEALRLGMPPYIISVATGLPQPEIEELRPLAEAHPYTYEDQKNRMIAIAAVAMAEIPTLLFPNLGPTNIGKLLANVLQMEFQGVDARGETLQPVDEAARMIKTALFGAMGTLSYALPPNLSLGTPGDSEPVLQFNLLTGNDPFMAQMGRFLQETVGVVKQSSQKERGGTRLMEAWTVGVFNKILNSGETSVQAFPAGNRLDNSDPHKNRGGDVLLMSVSEDQGPSPLALIDVTNRRRGSEGKKPSGIHIDLGVPTLVLYLSELKIHPSGVKKPVKMAEYTDILAKGALEGKFDLSDPFYKLTQKEVRRFVFTMIFNLLGEISLVRQSLSMTDAAVAEPMHGKLADLERLFYEILEQYDITSNLLSTDEVK